MSLGVGIVGLGFGARVHLPGFRRLEPEGVRVAAVCARDGARARQVADAAGVPEAYDDWRRLVDDPAVDLVSVATPPAAHAEIVAAALDARKPVLCEKPLAATVEAAERLEELAAAAGVPTLVDFEFRGLPSFRRARELLREGAIGRVLQLEVAWHLGSRLAAGLAPSWKDDAEAGGGTLLALGVHSFDYVEWLLGPVESLCGTARTLLGRGTSDDACAALMRLADGAHVTLSISTVAAHGRGQSLRFFGEEGTLVLENPDVADYMRGFRLALNGAGIPLPEPPDGDGRIAAFVELARELVMAIREGRPASPSFREGLRAQRLAEASRAGEGWRTV
ncbi:MAG: Gfo/Idh/MocA family oxidoreductase [Actinomycetota bacterium]